jgi:hypothetical protein
VDFEIEPNVGVGALKFGMSIEAIRQRLGSDVEPGHQSSTGIPTDFFTSLGVFAYYKQPGVLEGVEFAGPASPTFEGRPLLEQPFRVMERWFRTKDQNLVFNDAGFRSESLGIGLFVPEARLDPAAPVKGVIVFEPGFYQR